LNDLLLINGYAKATHQYFCSKLADYKILNIEAQLNELGIYSEVKRF
jgi:micrococcal nuclease